MMMWFPEHKALASAFPIISFGLGSTFSTFLHSKLSAMGMGLQPMLLWMTLIYAVMMGAGVLLLKKPVAEEELRRREAQAHPGEGQEIFSYGKLLGDRFFLQSWLFMLLNISSGLCLIPLARQMMQNPEVGYSAGLTTVVIGLCGVMNGGGRFMFAWVSDH